MFFFTRSKKQKLVNAILLVLGFIKAPLILAVQGTKTKLNRIIVYDNRSGTSFLVDTGADISLLPVDRYNKPTSTKLKLLAANNTLIPTYGFKKLNLDLGFNHNVEWSFCLTPVAYAIISADLMYHFGLLVELRKCLLIERATLHSTKGIINKVPFIKISVFNQDNNEFALSLQKFPTITGLAPPYP